MIHIEKNQLIPEHPDLRVLSASGDYSDNDLIECAKADSQSEIFCAFPATYVKYGNIAHQFSDPLALGSALLQIDPESTHDAVIFFKEEEARRIKREGGDFTPENPVEADEKISKIAQEEAEDEDDEETESPAPTEPEPAPEEPLSSDTPVIETPPAPTAPEPVIETPPAESPKEEEEAPEPPSPIGVIADTIANTLKP